MNNVELIMLQCLPLEVKIRKSKERIKEWIDHYGQENVYGTFSGGLGSTALFFLLQEVVREQGYKQIPCLFVNTRNEHPSIVHHVYSLKGQYNSKYRKIMKDRTYDCPRNYYDCIEVRKPEMKIRDVIKEEGYLVVSKKTSRCISDLRKLNGKKDPHSNERRKSLLNTKNRYSVSKRWQFLIDADIKISHKCCDKLKHSVYKAFEKETGRKYPISGDQACESMERKKNYLRFGCNGFGRKQPRSTPIAFWTPSDVAEYIFKNNLPYAKAYGNIVFKNGRYITTGESRTGCMCCFANLSKEITAKENRFQRMDRDIPNIHKYVFKPLNEGGLGGGEVLDLFNIPYHEKEILSIDELFDLIGSS